jgi:hypothetical protein
MEKIWKYIDLTKLISLLANDALYFSCPCEFADPYEGYLPKSHLEAISKITQKFLDEQFVFRDQIVSLHPNANLQVFHEGFNANINRYIEKSKGAIREASLKFGVSCWHRNEYESEAMWRLYSASGQGIAIESTVKQLHDSIIDKTNVHIDNIRYMDFEKDPIEKGHKHYGLFIKRKSFEHEKELRAIILLKEEGKGTLVKCDLDILINTIHISPFAPPYFKEVVEKLCVGNIRNLQKTILQSSLFDKPNY